MKLAITITQARSLYSINLPAGLKNLAPRVADVYKRRDRQMVQKAREMHTEGHSPAAIQKAILDIKNR